MPIGLSKAKYPNLYTIDHNCETEARAHEQKREELKDKWLDHYKNGKIKEVTLRYCLSLTGMKDAEIQDEIDSI